MNHKEHNRHEELKAETGRQGEIYRATSLSPCIFLCVLGDLCGLRLSFAP
jgi:hypothetical protein